MEFKIKKMTVKDSREIKKDLKIALKAEEKARTWLCFKY
jgi:hypothetical protein